MIYVRVAASLLSLAIPTSMLTSREINMHNDSLRILSRLKYNKGLQQQAMIARDE